MIVHTKRMNLILNCFAICISFALRRIEALDSQGDAGSSSQFLSPSEKRSRRSKRFFLGKTNGLNNEFADLDSLQRRMADVVPNGEPTIPPNLPPVDIRIPIGLTDKISSTEEGSPVEDTLSPTNPPTISPSTDNSSEPTTAQSVNNEVTDNPRQTPSMLPSTIVESSNSDSNNSPTGSPAHSANWCPTYFSGNGFACGLHLPSDASWIQCAYPVLFDVNGDISNEVQTCTCTETFPFWRCKINSPNADTLGTDTSAPSVESTTGLGDIPAEATTQTSTEDIESSSEIPSSKPSGTASSAPSDGSTESNDVPTDLSIDEKESSSLNPDGSLIVNTSTSDSLSISLSPSLTPTDELTSSPIATPSLVPTLVPSDSPILSATSNPISEPKSSPTAAPFLFLAENTSVDPSPGSSLPPSIAPVYEPTISQTVASSFLPSDSPSILSLNPTVNLISESTKSPSENLSTEASDMGSIVSSSSQTVFPSLYPSDGPSLYPSDGPSLEPSIVPTSSPFFIPTGRPNEVPNRPSKQEPAASSTTSSTTSSDPTHQPTSSPIPALSLMPSDGPSLLVLNPSTSPSSEPTKSPTNIPTKSPTIVPSSSPSAFPSVGKSFSQRLPPGIFARRTSPPTTSKPTETPTNLPSASLTSKASNETVIPSTISASDISACRNASSVDRREDIFRYLSSLSDAEAFDDPEHPVFMATSWIVDEDQLQVCPGDPNFTQRYVLALLYFSTSGDNWIRCTRNETSQCLDERFLSDSHECNWGGITCDSQNRVIKLNLGKSVNLLLSTRLDLEIFVYSTSCFSFLFQMKII